MPSPVVVPGYVDPGYFEGDVPSRAGLRGRLGITPNLGGPFVAEPSLGGSLDVRPSLGAIFRIEPLP